MIRRAAGGSVRARRRCGQRSSRREGKVDMTAFKLLVLLVPLFLVGTGLASADDLEKTPEDELRERGFQVSEGCASHKHGDQWASATKGVNCACARRRSLCYSVTCLPDTRLAVAKGRWDCVFDNDKHNVDPIPDVKPVLPQETWINAQRKETRIDNLRPGPVFRSLDVFSAIFAVVSFLAGAISDQQSQQEVMDKLEDLERKIDDLSDDISDLHAEVAAGNQWIEGVVLYGRSEQRLRYLLHYLNERLSVDANGQLQPAFRAQLWADAVLSFSSDGVEEILFHLHDMMMGTLGVFGRKPLFLIFEARMDGDSSGYWNQDILWFHNLSHSNNKVKNFLEYIFSLEVSGYAAFATALNLKGRSDETTYILDEGKEKIEDQGNFLEPYVKGEIENDIYVK
ncbi:Hypp3099 [Branchiostoma lanceolatum]|uniref:Hypp3099 protein n=1 Tax=Branchiostoma lanceolatum TaxID=7740 RepID=A0A8J9ZWL4_BRALA|nr:Hypp3099 [Branchiostoma lanceolatum]